MMGLLDRLAVSRLFELMREQPHHLLETVIALHFRSDRFASVQNGPVIAAAEGLSDLLEAFPGHFAAEIHGHHTGQGNVGWPPLAGHVCHAQVVAFSHSPLDQLDGDDWLGFLLDEVFQQLLDLCGGDVAVVQGGPGRDAVQGTFLS